MIRSSRAHAVALVAVGVILGVVASGRTSPLEAASKKVDTRVSSFCTPLEPKNAYGPCVTNGKSIFTVVGTPNPAFLSSAVGTDGKLVTSYRDSAGVLQVAKCVDIACGSGKSIVSIVGPGPAGWTALAIGADGFPVIAFSDDAQTDRRLMVAKCNDIACKGGDETISQVDATSNQDNGAWPSIAIGADGNPVISYASSGGGNQSLKVVKCSDPACAGVPTSLQVLDTEPSGFIRHTSIAVGRDGNPVVSYSGENNLQDGVLLLLVCNDPACAGGGDSALTLDVQIDYVGQFTSVAFGLDGNPVISEVDADNGDLRVLKCIDRACGTSVTNVVDSPGTGTGYTSLAIAASGNPVISYQADENFLKMVRCNDPACAGGDETVMTVDDPLNSVGENSSIDIGVDRDPIIAYADSGGGLKVARVPG